MKKREKKAARPECRCAGPNFNEDVPCPVPGHGKAVVIRPIGGETDDWPAVQAALQASVADRGRPAVRKREMRVVEIATKKAVRTFDVTGKSERQIEKLVRGLLINMDRDRFYVDDGGDTESAS